MPDLVAERGDIYLVKRNAVSSPNRDLKPARPMVCVAELPTDPHGWRAMARITTWESDEDLSSEADDKLGLSEDGWWTWRYLHTVRKNVTGKLDCGYKGTLLDPERTRVLTHYKNRPRN